MLSPPEYAGSWRLLYDWQTIITGGLAILAAVIGGRMTYRAGAVQAKATREAAEKQILAVTDAARSQREADQQRREDAARPICVLMPYYGIDPWHERDTLLAISDKPPTNPNFGMMELKCSLRNIGTGPALDLTFSLRILEGEGYKSSPWELSPLYAGESLGGEGHSLRIPMQIHERFNKTDLSLLGTRQWQLILVYKDVFGNAFYSIHHKSPIKLSELYSSQPASVHQPWVTVGRGTLPE